ncbi:MAG TPA: B-box zinc finger protein [Bacillota bacterium]|nr:B-box zinc finger protein [Bacillota bacterium]
MNCKYHKESEAKFICDKCKQPICEECSVDVNGNKICSSCIQKSLFSENRQHQKPGFFENLAFFCFAVVPGAAQMYMGLFKRGFQLMFGFISAIVLFSYLNTEGMMLLIIIPTWFFSFFDSYAIRRRIRKGEEVGDTVIFDYDILIGNKRIVGMAMLLLGILGVVNAFEHSVIQHIFGGNLYWSIKRSIMPIALIGAGVYMLSKSKKKEVVKNTEDIIEIEEEDEEEIEAAE